MRIFFTIMGAITLLTSTIGLALYSPRGASLHAGLQILRRRATDSKIWIISVSERLIWLAFAGSGLRIFESNITRLNQSFMFSSWFDELTIIITIVFGTLASCWRLGAYLFYRRWPTL